MTGVGAKKVEEERGKEKGRKKTKRGKEKDTHDSKNAPNVIGMKRGAWMSTVDTMQWYTTNAIASARLPGRKSIPPISKNKNKNKYCDDGHWEEDDVPGRG